jgi:hypothetical protein
MPKHKKSGKGICLQGSMFVSSRLFGRDETLLCLDLLCFGRARGSFVQTKGFSPFAFQKDKKAVEIFSYFFHYRND